MIKLRYRELTDKKYLSEFVGFLVGDPLQDYYEVHFNKFDCRLLLAIDEAEISSDAESLPRLNKSTREELNKIRKHENWVKQTVITTDDYSNRIKGSFDPEKQKVILEARRYELAYRKIHELIEKFN